MRRPFILIIGSPNDPCACLTRQVLLQRGTQVVSFDEDDLLTTVGLNWSVDPPDDSSFLAFDGARIPVRAVSGVLVRFQPWPLPDPGSTPKEQLYISGELQATLFAFLQSLDCRVINCPTSGVTHRVVVATVERAGAIREAGFRLPRVLATPDAAATVRFWEACGRSVLLRRPSGWQPWRWVNGPAAAAHWEALLTQQPLYLQELPAGQWLRAYVVGARLFGVVGDITRRSEPDGTPSLLPVLLAREVQQQCFQLARLLDLKFAQIDLVQTPGGDLYCLDAGGWPDLEPCEPELQRAIAAALADLLEGDDRRGSHDPGVWRSRRHGDGVRLLAPVVPSP